MTLELLVTSISNTNNPRKKRKKKKDRSQLWPLHCRLIFMASFCLPCVSPRFSWISAPAASPNSNCFQEGPQGAVGRHMPSLISLAPGGQDSHPGHLLCHLVPSSPAFTSLGHLFMASALGSSSCRWGSGF